MIDREKVIKGQQSCLDGGYCGECPYFEYKDGLREEAIECREKLGQDTIALLKEQEPKTSFKNSVQTTTCPVCGSVLSKTVHSIPE